jgi:hypothetical protein
LCLDQKDTLKEWWAHFAVTQTTRSLQRASTGFLSSDQRDTPEEWWAYFAVTRTARSLQRANTELLCPDQKDSPEEWWAHFAVNQTARFRVNFFGKNKQRTLALLMQMNRASWIQLETIINKTATCPL